MDMETRRRSQETGVRSQNKCLAAVAIVNMSTCCIDRSTRPEDFILTPDFCLLTSGFPQ
jgi:hypothetical protein